MRQRCWLGLGMLMVLSTEFQVAQGTATPVRPHPPVTQERVDFTPRPYLYVEPAALNLPSPEALKTVVVKDRTFHIQRVSPQAKFPPAPRGADYPGLVVQEKNDETLVFVGSGRGGVDSKERLLVENCTFVIDFTEGDFEKWDVRRAAIYVEGYREVLVRHCVFVSRATAKDPLRRVIGSIIAYDCMNVQIDNCYFTGRTVGFRGHVIVFGCGPTSIRHCEIDGNGSVTGGLWIATGVGEGKISYPHDGGDPALMIYPAGPLRVENCWVHDQKGRENADGIYVQSVQPYLIRNCKVENWGEDSLVDVGFRDTPPHQFAGKPLINHGAVGVIEHCEFGNGWIKDSVGLAGGLIFRHNLIKSGAWLFPYAFDGGGWYVIGNRFENMTGVIVSGKNNQFDGWTPREGMLTNGTKMYLYNNHFQNQPGVRLKGLLVAGAKPAPLKDVIVADYNVYQFDPLPANWATDIDQKYPTLDAWRQATNNDRHSVLGAGSLAAFAAVDPSVLKLPGGIAMSWGECKTGLVGPVGVTDPELRRQGRALAARNADDEARDAQRRTTYQQNLAQAKAEQDRRNVLKTVLSLAEVEPLAGAQGRLGVYGSDNARYRLWQATPGQSVSFPIAIPNSGPQVFTLVLTQQSDRGQIQAFWDDQPLGTPMALAGAMKLGTSHVAAGEHRLTLKLTAGVADGQTKVRLGRIEWLPAATPTTAPAR